jgi:hypothetical protein
LPTPSHSTEPDPDDLIEELPALDLPLAGADAPELQRDDDDGLTPLRDLERSDDDGVDGPSEGRPLDADLDTIDDEPSALGDDGSGVDDDDDTIDDLAGPSFVGPDEAPLADEDDELGDEEMTTFDDGGAEGLDDPEGEDVDDLPPLDGHRDEDDDDDAGEEDPELSVLVDEGDRR